MASILTSITRAALEEKAYREQKAIEEEPNPPVSRGKRLMDSVMAAGEETMNHLTRVEQVGPCFCFICLNDDGPRSKLEVRTNSDGARFVCEDAKACRNSVIAQADQSWFTGNQPGGNF